MLAIPTTDIKREANQIADFHFLDGVTNFYYLTEVFVTENLTFSTSVLPSYMQIGATNICCRNFDENVGRLFDLWVRNIFDANILGTFINQSLHVSSK